MLNQLKCTCLKQEHAAGVIWRGDSLIDGVPETLDYLRSLVSVCYNAHKALLCGVDRMQAALTMQQHMSHTQCNNAGEEACLCDQQLYQV